MRERERERERMSEREKISYKRFNYSYQVKSIAHCNILYHITVCVAYRTRYNTRYVIKVFKGENIVLRSVHNQGMYCSFQQTAAMHR